MSLAANISLTLNMEPDPSSALALGIWYTIQAIIGVPVNLLVILLWLTTAELRNVPANVFIVNLAIADVGTLLTTSVFNLHWSLFKRLDVCKVGGFFTYFFALYGICILPFLAINRDTVIRRNARHPLKLFKERLFSRTGTTLISAAIWLYLLTVNLTFAYFDMYGREAIGACGLVFDLNDALFVMYYLCVLGPLSTAMILTIVYYRRLNQWITKMTNGIMSNETVTIVNETKKLMKMTKLMSIMPLLCIGPPGGFNFFVRFVPYLVNVRVGRIIVILLNFPSLFNPIFTLCFMVPFRKAFVEKMKTARLIFNFINRRTGQQTTTMVENVSAHKSSKQPAAGLYSNNRTEMFN